MPGLLRKDAVCPKCGDDLQALVDTSSAGQVKREFYHAKGGPKTRRRRRCVTVYYDLKLAADIRRNLEIPIPSARQSKA